MGHGSFTSSAWSGFTASTTAGKSTAHVFSSRGLKESMDPAKVVLRESCDGPDNPASTPILINVDVTGSMGIIPDYFVRTGLPVLFEEVYNRKPVTDPHIGFGGIGDVVYDRAPYQVSQFEADITIAKQLTDLYLEAGGGGNSTESYTLPWYFAAMKTKIDSMAKRNKKGYLFTIGDEECPTGLSAAELEKVFGPGQYNDLTTEQLLEMASKNWHVFHIVVEEGSHARSYPDRVRSSWTKVLGQHVLFLSDYKKLSEVIVSAIEATEGKDVATVAASWTSKETSLVVAKAIGGLTKATGGGSVVTATEAVEF